MMSLLTMPYSSKKEKAERRSEPVPIGDAVDMFEVVAVMDCLFLELLEGDLGQPGRKVRVHGLIGG